MWLDGCIAAFRARLGKAGEDRRLLSLRAALAAALGSVEADVLRLERRLEAERGWLALCLGNEDGTRFDRERAQEQLIDRAERIVRRTAERLAALQTLRQTFTDAGSHFVPRPETIRPGNPRIEPPPSHGDGGSRQRPSFSASALAVRHR